MSVRRGVWSLATSLALLSLVGPIRAQETSATPATPPEAGSTEASAEAPTGSAETTPDASTAPSTGPTAEAAEATEPPPRVAVVLIGDPNDEARALAARVEQAAAAGLELPSDPALRASLLGATSEDAIAPVVRDRRLLGASEREDVPLLRALGDRADVVLLLVVRRRAGARELVAFDVRHGAFFEGALSLEDLSNDTRITRFAQSRARAALEGPATAPSLEAATESAIVAGASEQNQDDADEPDWLEANWPFLLAGGLLAGAAAFVIVYTAAGDSEPTPMLRFRPGGSP